MRRWTILRRLSVAISPVAAMLASPTGAVAIPINEDFKPQNEFKLDPWLEIPKLGPVDLSINKAVAMLLLAMLLTIFTLTWLARRLAVRPNNVQTLVEVAYDMTLNTLTRANMDERMAKRWFHFIATLFFFVWFSNIIGFLPLPFNTTHMVTVGGYELPTLGLYAATANISVPLALALVVWISYHFEGIREHGPIGYFKGWVPAGVPGPALLLVVPIEALSQVVRLISLSARLFANMLAGHILILIMGGGMVVLLGSVLVAPSVLVGAAFFLFEVGLVASLQAFIFAVLSAIYLGGAVAQEH